ncbi:hypothetical protein PNA2_1859 [Pyrococcus sp. NA2]|uniref:OadG family protein n=1 Tax=Pyrococcus sp. (strain NA2) TaxID=342949 RepID=UPI000209AC86|nr:OadG family transporter subunit [Pyrococcus sp. NA2]AEC52774.1 hypothetical protein PNA2_1859 [Pyrococcus sp. NA2]
MNSILEGFYITILGVTVVFVVLSILAVVMYGVGEFERRSSKKPEVKEKIEEKVEEISELNNKKIAIITAAIMAYLSQKAPKEVPIRRKPSQNWWFSSLTREIEDIENFNYRWLR